MALLPAAAAMCAPGCAGTAASVIGAVAGTGAMAAAAPLAAVGAVGAAVYYATNTSKGSEVEGDEAAKAKELEDAEFFDAEDDDECEGAGNTSMEEPAPEPTVVSRGGGIKIMRRGADTAAAGGAVAGQSAETKAFM